jgi:hypothetical protein
MKCSNPKCQYPARDDDYYQDTVGNVYCGPPCMMKHGTFPQVECPRCKNMVSENETLMSNKICLECFSDLAETADYERDERLHNPDYRPEDWKDFLKWTNWIYVEDSNA